MLDCFENKVINGIHCSRYVASWRATGCKTNYLFKLWLEQLVINERKLTANEVQFIYNFATCGKLELESNAKLFKKKYLD